MEEEMTPDEAPPWLDEEFVVFALQGSRRTPPNFSIKDMEITSALPRGNFLGKVFRVLVNYSWVLLLGNTETRRFIVKTPPVGPLADAINAKQCVDKEIFVYDNILPGVTEVLGERISPLKSFSPREDTLVLEDLHQDGYVLLDRYTRLDYEHCVVALQVLAKFHAASIVLFQKSPEDVKKAGEEVFFKPECQDRMQPFFKNTLNILANEVKSWQTLKGLSNIIQQLSSTAWEVTVNLVQRQFGSFQVLNHGDFEKDNILFKYENNKVVSAKLVDFQFCRFGSPALDLQNFIVYSVNDDVRTNKLGDLLMVYVDSLNMILSRVGCVEETLSLEDLHLQLKETDFFGLIVSIFHLPFWVAEPIPAPIGADMEVPLTVVQKLYTDVFRRDNYKNNITRIVEYFSTRGLFKSI
uniref:CHK kinase-like domain-containing protein n=1 Tax=Clastoptera arizonana TaxID=38151 RepID=A0A1B6C5Y9_9HEMI